MYSGRRFVQPSSMNTIPCYVLHHFHQSVLCYIFHLSMANLNHVGQEVPYSQTEGFFYGIGNHFQGSWCLLTNPLFATDVLPVYCRHLNLLCTFPTQIYLFTFELVPVINSWPCHRFLEWQNNAIPLFHGHKTSLGLY